MPESTASRCSWPIPICSSCANSIYSTNRDRVKRIHKTIHTDDSEPLMNQIDMGKRPRARHAQPHDSAAIEARDSDTSNDYIHSTQSVKSSRLQAHVASNSPGAVPSPSASSPSSHAPLGTTATPVQHALANDTRHNRRPFIPSYWRTVNRIQSTRGACQRQSFDNSNCPRRGPHWHVPTKFGYREWQYSPKFSRGSKRTLALIQRNCSRTNNSSARRYLSATQTNHSALWWHSRLVSAPWFHRLWTGNRRSQQWLLIPPTHTAEECNCECV